jgi:DNA-binding NarL/FixJ family response regulator
MLVLRIDERANVVGANAAAGRWHLVPLAGPCHRIVAARDRFGKPICSADCVRLAFSGLARAPNSHAAIVGGRAVELQCHRTADEVVVVIRDTEPKPPPGGQRLTPRELEVMRLVATGMTTLQVAAALRIKASTVRAHVEHVRQKLCAHTRAQAVVEAIKTGQI